MLQKFAKSLQSCPAICDPMDHSLPGFSVHGDSPGKNTGVSCHALFQGACPTQGSNPCLTFPVLAGRFTTTSIWKACGKVCKPLIQAVTYEKPRRVCGWVMLVLIGSLTEEPCFCTSDTQVQRVWLSVRLPQGHQLESPGLLLQDW